MLKDCFLLTFIGICDMAKSFRETKWYRKRCEVTIDRIATTELACGSDVSIPVTSRVMRTGISLHLELVYEEREFRPETLCIIMRKVQIDRILLVRWHGTLVAVHDQTGIKARSCT